MYADIGHFGALSVRLSAIFVVIPAILLCYLGQGAFLLNNLSSVSNSFYLSVPQFFFWPMEVS
jgi:KUP system potassium uptake protein